MRLVHAALRWVFIPLVSLAALMLVAEPANSDPVSDESAFVAKLNELRALRGLAPLQVNGALSNVARSWSQQMATAGSISHNPNLAAQAPSNWQRLGENVGVGPEVPELHDAFVNSPSHYSNMVDGRYQHVGVGVVDGPDESIFVTVNFMTPQPPPVVAASPPTKKVVCTKSRKGRKTCKAKPQPKPKKRRSRR